MSDSMDLIFVYEFGEQIMGQKPLLGLRVWETGVQMKVQAVWSIAPVLVWALMCIFCLSGDLHAQFF